MSAQLTEEYCGFLEKLKQDEHRSEALNSIKNLLLYKSHEAANTIKDVGLSKIFHCLTVKDKTQVDLTCEVLKLCFEKYNAGDVVRSYTSHIMYLLRHEKDSVRLLALDEVFKAIVNDPNSLPGEEYVDVFVAVAQLVSDKNTAIANKAILISSNLQIETYPRVLEEMKIAFNNNSSSKCNVFEVIVNISTKSPDLLKLSEQYGYIDFMLAELKSTDALYKMNILELLSRFAVTSYGVKHLIETGALKKISDLVSEFPKDPLSRLIVPGYLKLFGHVARFSPREIFEKYPVLLELLFKAFEDHDDTHLPVALDTLGFIGSTVEGKLSLAALGSKYTNIIALVGEIIKTGVTEIKILGLHCFANLIGYKKDPDVPTTGPIDHRVTLMTREWFRSLSLKPESMVYLYETCKNPFPDIRLAAFQLLDATCQHNWGEGLVAKTPGFIEYLLDRSADYTKESKEAKYEVIKKLSRSAAFDPNTIMKLTKYVEEGPFYSETIMQVAMEEGD